MITPKDGPERGQWLSSSELRSLNSIKTGRVVLEISIVWVLILCCLQLSLSVRSELVLILVFPAIGFLQNALSLWIHEASHYGLSRNKQRNDALTDLFIAGPLGITVAQYRWHHFPHHHNLNDPDYEINPLAWICVRGKHLFIEVLETMLGLQGLRAVARYSSRKSKLQQRPKRSFLSLIGFATFNAGLLLACILQGQWYLYFLLWVAPLFTLVLLIGNLRTIVEHQPSSDVCDTGLVKLPPLTRIIRCHFLERVLIAPVGFYLHHEHHLFPSVPCHRLKELRNTLEKRGYFRKPDLIRAEGYLRTIWRLSRKPGFGLRLR